jgi:hypothetical protein
MGQTTYTLTPNEAIAGMIADIRYSTVESFEMEDAAGIGFGLGVCIGAIVPTFTSLVKGCKALTLISDNVLGFTAQQHTEQGYPFTTASGTYAQGQMVNVLRKGKIWVVCNTGCAFGDQVYVGYTGSYIGQAGNSSSNSVLVTGCVFASYLSGAGIALVDCNMPGAAQGIAGATGFMGNTGLTGTTGSQGTTGLIGATGVKGSTGVQGSTGA